MAYEHPFAKMNSNYRAPQPQQQQQGLGQQRRRPTPPRGGTLGANRGAQPPAPQPAQQGLGQRQQQGYATPITEGNQQRRLRYEQPARQYAPATFPGQQPQGVGPQQRPPSPQGQQTQVQAATPDILRQYEEQMGQPQQAVMGALGQTQGAQHPGMVPYSDPVAPATFPGGGAAMQQNFINPYGVQRNLDAASILQGQSDAYSRTPSRWAAGNRRMY